MSESNLSRQFASHVRGHYAYVLLSLLLLFAFYPFAGETGWVKSLLEMGYLLTILSCLFVSVGRGRWKIVLTVALVVEALAVLARIGEIESLGIPGRVAQVLILIVVVYAVLRDVVRAREITMNTLYAAASVYLLMALAWASVFTALEAVDPGAFNLTGAQGEAQMEEQAQLLYFSLITLTTVGYGDISPASPQARMLAALEGLIGQLYVAIIIARLVALEISARRKRDERKDS